MKRHAMGKLCVGLMLAWLGSTSLQAQAVTQDNIRTTDYLVPHISTVPANSGKRVELFVREKVEQGRRGNRPVVLMIAGATISAIPDFDVQFENYSWMEYLATAGFEVFAMDVTGYGLSPRPMMDDPCNTTTSEQQLYLNNEASRTVMFTFLPVSTYFSPIRLGRDRHGRRVPPPGSKRRQSKPRRLVTWGHSCGWVHRSAPGQSGKAVSVCAWPLFSALPE